MQNEKQVYFSCKDKTNETFESIRKTHINLFLQHSVFVLSDVNTENGKCTGQL